MISDSWSYLCGLIVGLDFSGIWWDCRGFLTHHTNHIHLHTDCEYLFGKCIKGMEKKLLQFHIIANFHMYPNFLCGGRIFLHSGENFCVFVGCWVCMENTSGVPCTEMCTDMYADFSLALASSDTTKRPNVHTQELRNET